MNTSTSPTADATPVLKVTELCKHFGGVKAIDGIDLEVLPGEILGIIGPNGAGKTALINTITGFYRATSGHIHLGATEITHMPMHHIGRMGVSRTFQNIRLFKRMSVLENVLVAFKVFTDHPWRAIWPGKHRREVMEKAMHWLSLLQLADKANQSAASLAYGDARRLEIVRALAGSPQLLLLDEPAAGMNDSETQQLVRDVQKIRSHVGAIMLIEHDMNLIRQLSDRILAMDYGKKIAQGSPDLVLKHPEVLRAYLGVESESDQP
jgi:ABC-type branched-subunit amino acid transport system ATPase component